MKPVSFFIGIWISLIFVSSLNAQSHPEFPPAAFTASEKLPAGLLSGKSVVIIKDDEHRWKEKAEIIHRKIRDYGVDAIAYFHVSEFNSGIEIRRLFAENLKKREVRFIVLFDFRQGNVVLNITEFNKTHTFYHTGQESWTITAADLDQCMTVLYRKIGQSKLKLRNFLVAEVPEYFEDVHLIRASRNEQFARDLKLDKMAVVLQPYLTMPDNSENEAVKAFNQRLREDSVQLRTVMESYPFEYEIIPYTEDEESLRTQGFHFILYHVYNSGEDVKSYLNYKINPNETGYISVQKSGGKPSLKTIPREEKVYKYYVKHIYTRDIYLGKDWDADQDWKVALLNYIAGLKQATGVK